MTLTHFAATWAGKTDPQKDKVKLGPFKPRLGHNVKVI